MGSVATLPDTCTSATQSARCFKATCFMPYVACEIRDSQGSHLLREMLFLHVSLLLINTSATYLMIHVGSGESIGTLSCAGAPSHTKTRQDTRFVLRPFNCQRCGVVVLGNHGHCRSMHVWAVIFVLDMVCPQLLEADWSCSFFIVKPLTYLAPCSDGS